MNETQFDVNLQQEQLKEKVRLLEDTAGWSMLTKSQQRVIRLSLYVDVRARRNSDKSSRDYNLSQKYVSKMSCHTAIMSLETADIKNFDNTGLPNEVDKEFFVDEKFFNDLSNPQALRKMIVLSGYPIVVQPGFDPKLGTYPHASHSFLVLGPDSKGNIICWDKEGSGLEYLYRVCDLSVELDRYKRSSYWGIRELRSLSSVSKWSQMEKFDHTRNKRG